jgi:lipopolysaccharide transport system ATP-binding protein
MKQVSLENVGLDYRVLNASLRRHMLSMVRSNVPGPLGGAVGRFEKGFRVRALDGIDLDLREGDRIGLIGHNGSGKTTLLSVIAGIYPISRGTISVTGRVTSLLSIQLGIDLHSTGWKNIEIRAMLMGRSRAEIDSAKDEIAAFSELGEFLDLPVSTYSAGMRARLFFAVATAFKPDILLMDEWLSAGDANFRDKAIARLNAKIDDAKIMVFASHSPVMQRRICNKGLVLKNGKAQFIGDIDGAIAFAQELDRTQRALRD